MGFLKRGLDRLNILGRNATRNLRNRSKDVAENSASLFKVSVANIFSGLITMIMPIIIIFLLVVLFLACVWQVISNLTATATMSAVTNFVSSGNASTLVKEQYDKTGSLGAATDDDITSISDDYVESIQNGELSHLTSYFESKVTDRVMDNSGVYLETSGETDPIDLGEDYTIYEHMMNTERYNFNRITWKKYDRGVDQGTPKLTVDPSTRLQYPDDGKYGLEHFMTIVRPYLQSWTIPLSMMTGVLSHTSNKDVIDFAYAIIAEGYHKIEVEQHSLETRTRVNKYRKYDETTTRNYVERTCTTYRQAEIDAEGNAVIDEEGNTVYKYYDFCEDKPKQTSTIVKNKIEYISSVDSTSTTINYVLGSALTFDNMVINKYSVEKYYYDSNKYKEDKTKVDSYNSATENYYRNNNTNNVVPTNPKPNDGSVDVSTLEVVNTTTTSYLSSTRITKNGKVYTDTLVWKDELKYDSANSTKQEGYTLQQLTDYIGQDATLSTDELEYYEDVIAQNKLNLIDLLNAKKDIYNKYVSTPMGENIGYSRLSLATSYDLLKENLTELYSNYEYSIVYGQSIIPIAEMNKQTNATYDYSWLPEGSFGWPVPGNKTVGYLYGYTLAYYGYSTFHYGIDLWPDKSKGAYQTEIVAARDGIVTAAKDVGASNSAYLANSYGNYIKIDHGDGTETLYAHLTTGTFQVTEGQYVSAGQVIALMGNSGASTGEHLHFELRLNGKQIDPLKSIYNVKSIGKYAEYETLTDEQKYAITSGGQYEYVSSK